METFRKKGKEDMDQDVVFSHSIKAGKRIYYMDVRRTKKDDLYLSITESKKIASPDGDPAAASYEKHKIFLYREDFSKFIDGLSKAIGYIHENTPSPEEPEDVSENPETDRIDIEF